MRQTTMAGLDVLIAGEGDGPVVVLLHGFGAPGDDLAALAGVLDVPAGVRFVFPAAPTRLGAGFGDGRAWWMIDMDALERDITTGRPRDRSSEVPEGLDAARIAINALLDEVETTLHVTGESIVLGGFSQGAMLACDLAFRTTRPLAGLVLLSGTLLAAGAWLPRMAARRRLPVFQSHGDRDPLLPFRTARTLREHLTEAGLSVEWTDFPGGHEIPHGVVTRLGAFLTRVLQRPKSTLLRR